MNRKTIRRLTLSTGAMLGFAIGVFLLSLLSSLSASADSRNAALFQTSTGFKNSTYTVTEGGIISIDVELSPTSNSVVTVEYLTLDGTAKAGVDYVSASGTLTFPVGDSSESFLVQTIQNSNYWIGHRLFRGGV